MTLNFGEIQRRIEAATPEALGEAMHHILGVVDEQVPVETGRLVGSGAVHVDGDEASITFDGPYARYQHERLDLHHEHGNAKFLEGPVHSEAETAKEIVARRLGEAL